MCKMAQNSSKTSRINPKIPSRNEKVRARFLDDFWRAKKHEKCDENDSKAKKMTGPAECGTGGEDPRRGTRSDQGQNLGKSSRQRQMLSKSWKNLMLIQHAAAQRGGGSLRAFRRAISIWLWMVGLPFLSILSFMPFSLLARQQSSKAARQ